MEDDRLNSVHLEAPRRQEFRAARQALLGNCGEQTIAPENALPPAQTLIQKGAGSANAKFVLMDADYLYPLKFGLNTIGRMPDNDVVVEDAFVSRRHCAVVVHANDGCELHDVASKNGTFLNGKKIAGPTRLRSGDEIRMCDKNLVFMDRGTEPDQPSNLRTMME